jgi:hypothetical protein
MGPAEYYKIWDAVPDVFHGGTEYNQPLGDVLRKTGVTHILTFEPLPTSWPTTLLWRGFDPFLHRRWARDPREPIYLYRFDQSLGRAFAQSADGAPFNDGTVSIVEWMPHEIAIDADLPRAGRVVLTDLDFPGWTVTVDGVPATPAHSNLSRIVDVPAGKHRVSWVYWPRSVLIGSLVSIVTLTGAVVTCWIWRSRW